MNKSFIFSAGHVAPEYRFTDEPIEARPSAGTSPQLWYATHPKLGCSKDAPSPETAIRNMLAEHACERVTLREVIAWVTDEDIKAVRADDGSELLLVDGRRIPLTGADHHPTQQVINYCHCGKRDRRAMRRAWAAKAEG